MRRQRKRNLVTLHVRMQTGAATLENRMEVSKKVEIELPYNLAIALLGLYPTIQKKWC